MGEKWVNFPFGDNSGATSLMDFAALSGIDPANPVKCIAIASPDP
jgi:hypothetical protein